MIRRLINAPKNFLDSKVTLLVEKSLRGLGYLPINETRPEDVFIIGYPKSGNTWMQHLMTGINFHVDMSMIHNNLVRELTPDEHHAKFYKRYTETVCFKSHALPSPRYKRVIYVVRDGRDANVSFYKMQQGMGKIISLEDIIRKNTGLHYSWNDHVQAWIRNPYKAEIIYIRYEDIKSAPFNTLVEVCKFLNNSISDDLLTLIIKNCAFEQMRQKEESVFWDKSKEWKEGEYFVRKGEVGRYKDELNGELLKYFEATSAESLRYFRYT